MDFRCTRLCELASSGRLVHGDGACFLVLVEAQLRPFEKALQSFNRFQQPNNFVRGHTFHTRRIKNDAYTCLASELLERMRRSTFRYVKFDHRIGGGHYRLQESTCQ